MAYDYLGMLMASVLFPFVFLPGMGTAASTLFVANINVIALLWLRPELKRNSKISFYFLNAGMFFAIYYFRADLNELLTSLYLERH
jgi:predicted membrane-bound spermidine synthase